MRLGSERRSAGIAFDNPRSREDMRLSHRELTELTAAGLFSLRYETFYKFEFHFRSRQDWSTFLTRPRAGGLEADQNMIETALSRDDGRIIAVEEILAGAYERRPRPALQIAGSGCHFNQGIKRS